MKPIFSDKPENYTPVEYGLVPSGNQTVLTVTAKNTKPWEYGININVGFIRTFTKYFIEPAFIIPIFQTLKGDRVFYENPDLDIKKWFNGLGLSLKVGRFF